MEGNSRKMKVKAKVTLTLELEEELDFELALDYHGLMNYLDNKAVNEACYADSDIDIHSIIKCD